MALSSSRSAAVSMRTGMPLPEATMRSAISSPVGPGNVSVEDGDVIGVDAQQLQSGVAVTGDVRRDRLQAQTIADGLRHVGLVLDDQHAHAPMLEPARIVGVSKTAYAPATPRSLDWRRDPQPAEHEQHTAGFGLAGSVPPACSSSSRRSPTALGYQLPASSSSAASSVLARRPRDGHITHRRPSQRASWSSQRAPWSAWRGRRCRPRRHDRLR